MVKEVRVGETFCLLRGGDLAGNWVEAIGQPKAKLAQVNDIYVIPASHFVTLDQKEDTKITIAIDEFDPFELFEDEAHHY